MTKTMTKTFNPDTDPFDIERVEGVDIGFLWKESWIEWFTDDGRKMWKIFQKKGVITISSVWAGEQRPHSVSLPTNLPDNTVLDIMRANGWEG